MAQSQAQMAQNANVPKLRAEMPRPDALLEMLTNTEPSSPAYPAIYEQVALSQDAMSPSMKESIDLMKAQSFAAAAQTLQSLPPQFETIPQPSLSNFERAAGYPQTAPPQLPQVPALQGLPPQQGIPPQGMPQ